MTKLLRAGFVAAGSQVSAVLIITLLFLIAERCGIMAGGDFVEGKQSRPSRRPPHHICRGAIY